MKDSIHKYFRVGTILWMSYPALPPVEALKQVAADDFFDAVEVTQMPSAQEREAVRDMICQAHMRLGYGAQPRLLGPGLNPNALAEDERLAAEATLLEGLHEAAGMGARGLAFLAGKWAPESKEEAYAQLLKTTRRLCDEAEKLEMMVELEVFDYDMDKCALIGPAPLAARFAADMRLTHRNFGLIVDLSHFPTTYEDSAFVIRTLRPYITHFHIGNAVVKPGCPAYGDQHPRFGFPESANDTEQLLDFFRVLKQEGFFRAEDPYMLSFEVKPWADEDAQLVLAGTKRVIRRAWSLLEDWGTEA